MGVRSRGSVAVGWLAAGWWPERLPFAWVFWGLLAVDLLVLNSLLLTATVPYLANDSLSYLSLDVFRAPVYPAILDVLMALPGGSVNVVLLQLNVLLASLWFLGWQTHVCFGWRWLSLLTVLLPLGHSDFVMLPFTVLTESLFTSALLIHVAAAVRCVKSPSDRWIIVLALSAGFAGVLRPTAYALVGPLLIFFLVAGYAWRDKMRHILLTVLSLGLCWLLVSGLSFVKHGQFSPQSAGGLSLLGHVAWGLPTLLAESDPAYEHRPLLEDVGRRVDIILAGRPSSLSYPYEYQRYTSNEYNTLLWFNAVPVMRAHIDAVSEGADEAARKVAVNDLATELALDALRANPWPYLQHAFAHYVGLWRYSLMPRSRVVVETQRLADDHNTAMEKAPESIRSVAAPMDAPLQLLYLDAHSVPWRVLTLNRLLDKPLAFVAILLSLLVSLYALVKRTPQMLLALYCSALINACFVLHASVQVALLRYSVVFVPVLVLLFAVMVAILLAGLRKRTCAG